ncbi:MULTISPECIES: flavin-dependent oxidoreductase [Rhizobium/Agrobacterium group]|uniref:Flavin-dependent oxidoreductase n=1 Tax=Neorhizobium petrolearium TaxID=515361 RepID=A0ABY8M2E8_9HYPH|nr:MULTISPECIES: flavin-dependent oxidoreductase [Rhizobium/Agrobacterium group]KGD96983.1 salicylate 1-monooxygenase [Rhizobium sp. YS-1r]MCC2613054.1 flavin-dependent oxidoreductase [Neorhizobium petrolearium]WGI68151.1 flavin-dependent oxidoreductase [Neorhizobium petrolearium]
MKVLIAGAGIGGLTTALFLHRAGIEVEIFERAEEVRELGVGINMLPHAVGQLVDLGLMADLDEAGIRTRELIYANRFGQVVWQELRGLDAGYDVPQFSIHRGKLLGLIYRAVVNRLGLGAIRTGCRIDGFEQTAEGVTALLTGRDGSRGEVRGDLLIGADGIHSAVRAALYPAEGSPTWSGIMLWRGATQWPKWRDGRTMAIAGGNFAKFVYYPIEADPKEPERRLTNWAVMAKTAETGTQPLRREDWSRSGIMDEVLPFVRDRFHLDFVDPAAIIEATGSFYEYPNCDRDPLPRWSFGRVTLLGDAAHPMYPVGSNGASQAILDAKSISTHLQKAGEIEAALLAYDAERRPATSDIVLANRRGGPEGVIDMIEARAPDGFDDIDAIASYEERKSVVRGYASLAGFARP